MLLALPSHARHLSTACWGMLGHDHAPKADRRTGGKEELVGERPGAVPSRRDRARRTAATKLLLLLRPLLPTLPSHPLPLLGRQNLASRESRMTAGTGTERGERGKQRWKGAGSAPNRLLLALHPRPLLPRHLTLPPGVRGGQDAPRLPPAFRHLRHLRPGPWSALPPYHVCLLLAATSHHLRVRQNDARVPGRGYCQRLCLCSRATARQQPPSLLCIHAAFPPFHSL